jgi:two-component system chemotaxis response regulator CheY
MKILIVDDDVVSRMVLMHQIDSCGNFDMVEAENGADAWARLESGLRPRICFCDMRMPLMSGMELLRRVKQDAALCAMPFVLVSSAGERGAVADAIDAGAAGYLVKPFDVHQVRSHLDLLAGQTDADADADTEPAQDTLRRLGIGAERLLAYLASLQDQVIGMSDEIARLPAAGSADEVRARLERLYAGCVALGLHGAAAALQSVVPGTPAPAMRALFADVAHAVAGQAAQVRRLRR